MQTLKTILCFAIAAFFMAAAVSHFVHDDSFAKIVPPALPFPYPIVWITGIMEAVFAIMLVTKRWRALGGLLLAPFLLAVLPANIYMAVAGIGFGEAETSTTMLWVRVALQFPFIALILWASDAKNLTKRS